MEELQNVWLQLIFPYANFAIFLAMAVYFFRKPARNAAQQRRAEFTRLMDEASKARDEAKAKLAELAQREARLDQEVAELKKVSRESAAVEAAQIVADAERVAEHLKEEAKRIAHAEVEAAKAELRQEIVAAVRDGVTQRVKKELNDEAQLKIVRKQIGELGTLRAEG